MKSSEIEVARIATGLKTELGLDFIVLVMLNFIQILHIACILRGGSRNLVIEGALTLFFEGNLFHLFPILQK